MTRPRAAGLALAASFSVYLIPLVGPHAAWLLGEALFKGPAGKSPSWIAANCAVALCFQALAAGYFYWLFRKAGWLRASLLLVAVPLAFFAAQWIYMVALPTRFLEEPDTAPETASWAPVCTAPGVYQTHLRTNSELWVRFNDAPNGWAVLTMPGCRLTRVSLPQAPFTPGTPAEFSTDVVAVVPGGHAVVQKSYPRESRVSWFAIAALDSAPRLAPLDPPPGQSDPRTPVLSTDGNWTAWIAPIPGTGPPVLERVVLRHRDSSEKDRVVDLSALGPASYTIDGLDIKREELRLWRTDRLIAIGFDGRLKKQFQRPAEVRAQSSTFLTLGDHWLAWDGYREDGPYRMEWSLPGGSGAHRIPLGRLITSAAVDRAGKWIALSICTGLNIGNARDAVYVLPASGGHEAFRRYLPRYSRSPVAFLDGGYFAYSDSGGVHLLHIPE